MDLNIIKGAIQNYSEAKKYIKYWFNPVNLTYVLYGTLTKEIVIMDHNSGYAIMNHLSKELDKTGCKYALLDGQLLWCVRDHRVSAYDDDFDVYIFLDENSDPESQMERIYDDHIRDVYEKVYYMRGGIRILPKYSLSEDGLGMYAVDIYFMFKSKDNKWRYISEILMDQYPEYYIKDSEIEPMIHLSYDRERGKIQTISGYHSFLSRLYGKDYMTTYVVIQKHSNLDTFVKDINYETLKTKISEKEASILSIDTLSHCRDKNRDYMKYYLKE
jgi:hypothetical protein